MRILDQEGARLRPDPARVTDLAALLRVKAGLIEHERDLIAGAELARGADKILFHPGEDLRLASHGLVLQRIVGCRQVALEC